MLPDCIGEANHVTAGSSSQIQIVHVVLRQRLFISVYIMARIPSPSLLSSPLPHPPYPLPSRPSILSVCPTHHPHCPSSIHRTHNVHKGGPPGRRERSCQVRSVSQSSSDGQSPSSAPLLWISRSSSTPRIHDSPLATLPLSFQYSSFPFYSPFNCRQQPLKSKQPTSLLRKLTNKLKPPTLHPRLPKPAIASPTSSTPPSTRRSAVPSASEEATAVRRRRAALQQCGLVPLPSRDLSQLEEELDRRFSHVVVISQDQPEQGEMTTAEKIRREWKTKNESQPEKQDGDVDSKVPHLVTSDPLHPESLDQPDFTRNAEEQNTLELTLPASPSSVYSAPGTLLFSDIPEEDVTELEIEKVLLFFLVNHCLPLTGRFHRYFPRLPL